MEEKLIYICDKIKVANPKTRNAIRDLLKQYTTAIINDNSVFEIDLTMVSEINPEIINAVFKLIYDNIRALDNNE
jgi:hypothetical protein